MQSRGCRAKLSTLLCTFRLTADNVFILWRPRMFAACRRHYLASCELAADLAREWDRSDNPSSPSLSVSLFFLLSLRGASYLRSSFSLVPLLYFARHNLLASDAIRRGNVLKSRLGGPAVWHTSPDENLKGTTREKRHLTRVKDSPRLAVCLQCSLRTSFFAFFLSLLFFFLSGARLSTLGFCAAPADPSLRRGLDITSNGAHLMRFLFSSSKYIA